MIAAIPDWPFAPGEGPFHVKGVSYRGHRRFIDAHVPGGFAGLLDRLEPGLRRFYEQPFLANGWYDLAPLVAIAPVCGAALKLSADDYVVRRARIQVEDDMRGVYAFLIKLASARMIATRLPRLVSLYFDFTSTSTHMIDERRVVTKHHGLPRPLAPWMCKVASAYLERVLELAGSGEFGVAVGEFVSEGRAHGVELVGVEIAVVFG